MPRATRLPSPAMIVAVIALVLAVTGVGYAAAVLPTNSVGTKQLRKGAVSASKLGKGAVTPVLLRRRAGHPERVRDADHVRGRGPRRLRHA